MMALADDTPVLERLSYLAADARIAARRREQAIRDAYQAGVPVPKIAEAAGITRSRVYQVLRKK